MKWYAKYIVLTIAAIILLVVPLLKGSNIGSQPFLIERLANNVGFYDSLSFGGRFAAYSWGTPLVFSIAPKIMVDIFPFALGILTLLLFRLILKELVENREVRNISMLLLALSPSFIYLFSFSNFLFIPLFLAMAAFYMFMKNNLRWLTIPIVAILPLFDIVITSSLLIVLFCYSFFMKKETRKFFVAILIVTLVLSSALFSYFLYVSGSPQRVDLGTVEAFAFFSAVISDLGSNLGIGLFVLILAVAGIVYAWEKKYSNLFLFLSIFFLLIFSIFRQEALILLNLFLVLLAALGLTHVFQERWRSKMFKTFTLLIIIVGLAFSAGSQLERLVNTQPDQDFLDALNFLSQQEPGVVFSHYSRGVWINSAGHRNVLDENYLFVENPQERFDDMNTLFYSRTLEESVPILEKYSVDYVWIDKEFAEEVWSHDTEGLQFILTYTKSFKRVYKNDLVEIWEIRS